MYGSNLYLNKVIIIIKEYRLDSYILNSLQENSLKKKSEK